MAPPALVMRLQSDRKPHSHAANWSQVPGRPLWLLRQSAIRVINVPLTLDLASAGCRFPEFGQGIACASSPMLRINRLVPPPAAQVRGLYESGSALPPGQCFGVRGCAWRRKAVMASFEQGIFRSACGSRRRH